MRVNKSCNGRGASVVSYPKERRVLIAWNTDSSSNQLVSSMFCITTVMFDQRSLKTLCLDAKRFRCSVRWAADGECASTQQRESACVCAGRAAECRGGVKRWKTTLHSAHTHTHTHSERFKGTVCSGLDSWNSSMTPGLGIVLFKQYYKSTSAVLQKFSTAYKFGRIQ